MNENITILSGDCRVSLASVPAASVQCCVTSPPYWGLRSYLPKGHALKALEIGSEKSPEEYVAALLAVFAEVWRVLKDDGTVWLNLGDSYAGSDKGRGDLKPSYKQASNRGSIDLPRGESALRVPAGLKAKDLCMIPARVALALQAAGWYLRSDIIWAKKNCMPESVTDRPTRSHEYIFLLTKSPRYFYAAEAIKEPCIYDVDGSGTKARKARAEGNKLTPTSERNGIRMAKGGFKDARKMAGKNQGPENIRLKLESADVRTPQRSVPTSDKQRGHSRRHDGFNARWDAMERQAAAGDIAPPGLRNKRDVWSVSPAQYPDAHFATFPKELILPCVLAGSRPGDMVLDPFGGSGTTAEVAIENGRRALICELNDGYLPLIEQRTSTITPGLALS